MGQQRACLGEEGLGYLSSQALDMLVMNTIPLSPATHTLSSGTHSMRSMS